MDMYSCKSKTTVSTNTTSKRSSHSAKKLEAKKEKGTLKGLRNSSVLPQIQIQIGPGSADINGYSPINM